MAQTLFTARSGGVSRSDFSGFNLGDHVGDLAEDVATNRKLLSQLLSQKTPIFMNQVHGPDVVEVTSESKSPVTCDAIITREAGLPLAVLAADCLPILISSSTTVAAVHAGRKGVLNGIISNTVSAIRKMDDGELVARIGPAICKDCYEVNPEMYAEAIAKYPALKTSDQLHCLDLRGAAIAQLAELGVAVVSIDICTAHNSDFFSYRREAKTGRQAGVIVL